MDSIIKHLSKNCNVISNTKIEKIVRKNDKWNLYDQNKKSCGLFDWVILSIPAEQSLELISNKISSKELSAHLVKNKIATRNDNFYAWRCLEALGIDTDDGVLRTSIVHYNSKEDVDKLINALKKI